MRGSLPDPIRPGLFDGADFVPERDAARLTGQLKTIYEFMRSGQWHTLGEIAEATGAPESSASAQLRNLRKPALGGHEVQRKYLGSGLYAYKLITQLPLPGTGR